MTGPEHYAAAQQFLETAKEEWTGVGDHPAGELFFRAAQVHATLALVAAQVTPSSSGIGPSWSDVVAPD